MQFSSSLFPLRLQLEYSTYNRLIDTIQSMALTATEVTTVTDQWKFHNGNVC